MAEEKKKEDKEKRKPKDYDEKDVPKVLKGDVKTPKSEPLRSRKDYGEGSPDAAMLKEVPAEGVPEPKPLTPPKDYDAPCPCHNPQPNAPGAVSEEVSLPDAAGEGGFITILVCPDCGTEGPFNIAPPTGVPMEGRCLKCAKCKASIPFKSILKTASGKYVMAGSVDSLADRIKDLMKPDTMITKDLAADVCASLDKILKGMRKNKDKD